MHRYSRSLAILTAITFAALCSGQDAAKPKTAGLPRVSELWNQMAEPMSVAPFLEPMTLKEALEAMRKHYRERHDRDFPVVVNQQAFKDENAEAGDIYESPIRLATSPRIRTRGQILRELLRQVQTGNATYFLKPGVIEITTHSAVTSTQLLNQTVDLKFTRQPLSYVLEEIYEQTGVHVVLDPRVGVKVRASITITFTNDMALGTGLVLIAEMAQLKFIEIDKAIFMTTPAHARQLIWERGGLWHWRAEPYRKEAA